MARADYDFEILDTQGRNCIVICDLDLGSTSVTNDIENVVDEISKKEGINPNDYMIVYRDSEGMWDGWDNKNQTFIHLQTTVMDLAISRYIKLQLK